MRRRKGNACHVFMYMLWVILVAAGVCVNIWGSLYVRVTVASFVALYTVIMIAWSMAQS